MRSESAEGLSRFLSTLSQSTLMDLVFDQIAPRFRDQARETTTTQSMNRMHCVVFSSQFRQLSWLWDCERLWRQHRVEHRVEPQCVKNFYVEQNLI